mgnify:CR=1 FL=1
MGPPKGRCRQRRQQHVSERKGRELVGSVGLAVCTCGGVTRLVSLLVSLVKVGSEAARLRDCEGVVFVCSSGMTRCRWLAHRLLSHARRRLACSALRVFGAVGSRWQTSVQVRGVAASVLF